MSIKRQIRSFAHELPSGFDNPIHSHTWDQLLYGSSGALLVRSEGGTWVVPPQRAFWIPAGMDHGFRTVGVVQLRTLYLPENLVSDLPRQGCVVTVSPLLRELILHCVRRQTIDIDRDAALVEVVLAQLGEMSNVPLYIPWPRDPRARAVAQRLDGHPGDCVPLDDACRRAGASKRTIERLFKRETGLTLGRWRCQLRVCRSIPLVATGMPVAAVAEEMGYDSTSAFIQMFRRNLGETPARYHRGVASADEESLRTPIVPVPTVVRDTGQRLGPKEVERRV